MRLKQRVKLQQNTPSTDDHGQPIESWSTYRNCYANVEDKGGNEARRGDQVEDWAGAVVTIRYPREGRIPAAEDRVVYVEGEDTTRTLNIQAVRRVGADRRWLELAVREQP